MTDATPLIVWFRNDLRLSDNPALLHAANGRQPTIAFYILDETPGVRPLGAASRWWLDKSLTSLADDLRTILGGRLILRRGAALLVLKALIEETGATSVVWNRLYDAGSIERDKAIKCDLAASGVQCSSFNATLLNEPWQVTKADGGDFRVFTPYWRAARAAADEPRPLAAPDAVRWRIDDTASEDRTAWGLHPTSPDWSSGFHHWRPGEAGAHAQLHSFLSGGAAGYAERRNFPADPATSRLSPHLHFGEVGPRQVYAAAARAARTDHRITADVETFDKELSWREFNHQVLFHHPHIPTDNFREVFDGFPWRDDPAALEAWKRGRTGYPIVDAGMRQLWTTGWMHNRVRMIVASFLTKHLLIDWRQGEAWFWDTLVDADIANNAANWQWVAGSGADAAPYFRIFNPVLQGAKYDPNGDYVRQWAPELAGLPDGLIHRPWDADEQSLLSAGVRIGSTYPAPIIDHVMARERALAAYRSISAPFPPGRERTA